MNLILRHLEKSAYCLFADVIEFKPIKTSVIDLTS